MTKISLLLHLTTDGKVAGQAKKKGRPVFRGGTKPSFCFNGEIMLPGVADDSPRSLWALDSHPTTSP